jgi:hypothetical protein
MKITTDELKAIYRNMSDEELLSLDRDDLTEVALKVHGEELQRRGLHLDREVEQVAEDESFTAVYSYDTLNEAQLAQSVLEGTGIPVQLQNDTLRGRGFQVMVPASMADEAEQILKGPAPLADTEAIIIAARFEDGAFVPLEEVEIREGSVVEVHVPPSAFLS